MVPRSAWVLNFDAEDELAKPDRHTSSRAVEARRAALEARVHALVGPDDVLVRSDTKLERDAFVGRAWCPTPHAIRMLVAAGARPLPAPSFEILRRVNHRAFSAELGQTLPGARFVRDRDTLEATLAATTGGWLLKRPFGFAGRGRLRVRADDLGTSDLRWIDASLATGEGLQVEPLVDRSADFALHGYVTRARTVVFGVPTRQECDAAGAWKCSARIDERDLTATEERALFAAADQAGRALANAEYFGPFGVDAFRWSTGDGESRFNARCEINARYSMGWAAGMGTLRPDHDDGL